MIIEQLSKFATDHPFFTLLLILFAYGATGIFRSIVIRLTRTVMVTLRGWPPVHLDADGDWKPAATVTETESRAGDVSQKRTETHAQAFPTYRRGHPAHIPSVDD